MRLSGKLFISGEIFVKTGLHIGGSKSDVPIGGIENSIITTSAGVPFIPGSSLKGKLRSLLEKTKSKNSVCSCGKCNICAIFGTGVGKKDGKESKKEPEVGPTRLFVRDAFMNKDCKESMEKSSDMFSNLEFTYSESKWENVIDRKTGKAAHPRQIERVPAGAIFDFNMVYNFFEKEDINRFQYVLTALNLLEDDYLGGNGSRGYGQILFQNLNIKLKTLRIYETQGQPINVCNKMYLNQITEADYKQLFEKEIIFDNNGDESNG